jgi:hypothetical protein
MLPEPLVTANVDLRDFPYMPVFIDRLQRSKQWLMAKRRPEIGFYSMNLWMASWRNAPCGSLEDDDDVLSDAAMCPPEKWLEVKDDLLRGWVKCSDQRLYHPVVAELAKEAAEKRESYRKRARAGNEKRWGNRDADESPARQGSGESKEAKPEFDIGHEPKSSGDCAEVAQVSLSDRSAIAQGSLCPPKGREGKGIIESQDSGSSPSLLVASEPAPRKAKRAKAKTQIREDAQPTEQDVEAAERVGLDAATFRSEWRKFRDHHLANGSLMADWPAAWRKWLSNVGKFQPARAGPQNTSGSYRNGLGELAAEIFDYGKSDGKQTQIPGENVPRLPFDGRSESDAGGWHDCELSGAPGRRSG